MRWHWHYLAILISVLCILYLTESVLITAGILLIILVVEYIIRVKMRK